MTNKMLIDASHPEETRVVTLRGNRVEDFDFEAASKRQLRGNIYLAKVTRVEPSLQAAFVEYGGNRHGFLAFSEIHPDYYQIPVADRQALLDEEARSHAQDDDEERPQQHNRRGRRRRPDRFQRRRRPDESVSGSAEENGDAGAAPGESDRTEVEAPHYETALEAVDAQIAAEQMSQPDGEAAVAPEPDVVHVASVEEPEAALATAMGERATSGIETDGDESAAPSPIDEPADDRTTTMDVPYEARAPGDGEPQSDGEAEDENDDEDDEAEETEEEVVDQVGGDAMEEMPHRAARQRRQYKIQEVIKRRQVLLVQVVKEERGGKGAALTSYLSLAGRYCVLMPNTARGGGISRKITDATDRKRLKEIAQELEVPEGMGLILRTAGASRTTSEVNRDFDYLLRMWESVRELTLKSTAPSLVYEEGSLIKRSIRDLYNKEIDEVVVAGENGFREARDYMRMLLPSHEKNVRPWRETQALFAKSGVDAQLDAMFSNVVTLRSGGYLVINQAEALVAIDVNSGRSTREHNIEDTALRTNLEAADEVARQLRLRDLAGLIVVDFIDMEEHRNNRAVERRMKDALKNDRARIQVGRISHFGLLEMSRQRMRTGVLEGSTIPCPHCGGTGHMRSTASIALHVLRAIEDTLGRSASHNLIVRCRTEVALYILNHKRANVRDIEERFGAGVIVAADDSLSGSTYQAIERGELASPPETKRVESVRIDSIAPAEYEEPAESEAGEDEEDASSAVEQDSGFDATRDGGEARPRRRRRRRGRGDHRDGDFQPRDMPQPSDGGLELVAQIGGDLRAEPANAAVSDGEVDQAEAEAFDVGALEDGGGRQPRSRRGGRRRRGGGDRNDPRGWRGRDETGTTAAPSEDWPSDPSALETDNSATADAGAPAPGFSPEPTPSIAAEPQPVAVETPTEEPNPEVAAAEPPPAYHAPLPEAAIDPTRPKRSGWWQRAKQTLGGS